MMVQSTLVYCHLFQVKKITPSPHSYHLPPRPRWIAPSWCASMDWIPAGSIRSVTSLRTHWSGQESVCVWRGMSWGQITSVFSMPVPPRWVHMQQYMYMYIVNIVLECTCVMITSLMSINLMGFLKCFS